MSKHQLPSGHKARKRFGQNFLIDQGIINHIVRSVGPRESDNIVEIGPGQGAITSLLLERCPRLNVIELDRDLIPVLLSQFAKYQAFKIHQTDALKFNFSELYSDDLGPLRVVGNLPYNISTPLIFHLISHESIIQDMHFMLQKEVVERLAAKPNEKNYGRLSIMVQYYCEVENLFDVPPESFSPAPKVDSAIVRLTPYKTRPYQAKSLETFEIVVRTAFSQRRKTLRNALKTILTEHTLEDYPLDFSQRPEDLSISDYIELSNFIWQQNESA